MPLISITRLRIRKIWFLPKFFWYASKSYKQSRKAKGIIDSRVFNDSSLTFWTCSIWEDERSMLEYMRSGAHKKAMPYLQHWCNEAYTAHSFIASPVFPSAGEMGKLLMQHGRPSKVKYPSDNHVKGIFKEPAFKV